MAIEMGKKYRTRDGRDVRILCVDAPFDLPVVGLIGKNLGRWTRDGRGSVWVGSATHHQDLIELPPYSDIEIDAPGWARTTGGAWVPRHFAGVSAGVPLAWWDGQTSHTAAGNTSTWDEFTTTKPEGYEPR